jgi:4-hydroxybutyrate CoA-transferase
MTLPPRRSAAAALARIPSGTRLVTPPAMGEPTTLLRTLPEVAAGRDWTLCSGLQISDYPFLPAVLAGELRYETWHVMRPVRDLVADGTVQFIPARASQIPRLVEAWAPGGALVRVGPPDADGLCSLGPSASYHLAAIRAARVAIAEIDPDMPRAHGDALVPVSLFDSLVESEAPIAEYDSAPVTPLTAQIAKHILDVLPQDPTIQIGIGAIPESLIHCLTDVDLGTVRFAGLAIDPMVDLFEAGVLRPSQIGPEPAILCPEMQCTRKLLDFMHDNPAIEMHPSSLGHDAALLGRIDRFVSINTALEVDLQGNVNSEIAGGRQISGTGGSIDYNEAAARSAGGIRVIALASTSPDGSRSNLVPGLRCVTIPRSMVDVVVTEHGAARLTGLPARARAEALIEIADPRHRTDLQDQLREDCR